jgi:hypothetical protein
MKQLVDRKHSGGPLELRLADGSLLTVELDSGKPFIGLLNVFMYIVRMNKAEAFGDMPR